MKKTFTISEKYNSFLWLPPKTASSTLSWILAFFDFSHFIEIDGNLKFFKDNLIHFGHETHFPPNYEKMSFILSTANPYDRVFSLFKMGHLERQEKITKEDFNTFLEKQVITNKNFNWIISETLGDRNPTFIIKKENLYGDLLKIPFISESNLNQCGILKEMCNKKINSSFEMKYRDELLDNQNKNLIYDFFKKDFDYFKYSK